MGRGDLVNFLCIDKIGRVRTVKWEHRSVKHYLFRIVYCDVISKRGPAQTWLLMVIKPYDYCCSLIMIV